MVAQQLMCSVAGVNIGFKYSAQTSTKPSQTDDNKDTVIATTEAVIQQQGTLIYFTVIPCCVLLKIVFAFYTSVLSVTLCFVLTSNNEMLPQKPLYSFHSFLFALSSCIVLLTVYFIFAAKY